MTTQQQQRYEPRRNGVYAADPQAFGLMFLAGADVETVVDEGVAVVRIDGPLEYRSGWPFDCYESILERFTDAVNDDTVRAVVLRISSPGGDVEGLMETVRQMREAKEAAEKPVYAYADELAASAAYALACVADEIYIPPTGGVGSIGVVAMLFDQTKRDSKEGERYEVIVSGARKPDGNPHVQISDGARKRVDDRVQSLAGVFFDLVADSRGIAPELVKSYQADVFYGADAVTRKLADGVMSLSDVIELAREDAP